ncbi:ParB N-terminal domain-containing protein [Priestia filamentosa]|uniref:ParB N-terminal domain-containing protein n=1 Tax=Priestia filamentosa TaxID=1402861 RepID=UPI00398213F9
MSNTSTEQDLKVISNKENNNQLLSNNDDVKNKQVNHSEVIGGPINQVIPNLMSPRKDNSVKTEHMQEVIKKRGGEEQLVVYKQGKSTYVLLAGHRRLLPQRLQEKNNFLYTLHPSLNLTKKRLKVLQVCKASGLIGQTTGGLNSHTEYG